MYVIKFNFFIPHTYKLFHQETTSICWSGIFTCFDEQENESWDEWKDIKCVCVCVFRGVEGGFQQASHNISTLQIYRDLLDMEVH